MPKRSEGPKIKWFEERGAFYVTWTEGRRSRKCSTGATSREEAEIFLAELGCNSESTASPSAQVIRLKS